MFRKGPVVTPELKAFLDEKAEAFNKPFFIEDDPVSIPHAFTKREDIEISAFFAATLAWGQRKTIISKCRELFCLMDNEPHDFVLNHSEGDLKTLLLFKHRTFNTTDLLWFIEFFRWYYQRHTSLEWAFAHSVSPDGATVEPGLIHFHRLVFGHTNAPARTRKHVATPERGSACKRLNMFLRWMVRKDSNGVDFGLWSGIRPSQLVCPCDLHVDRVARALGLIERKQTDWLTALELTENLRLMDPADPVKYDFALFGIGVMEKPNGLLERFEFGK